MNVGVAERGEFHAVPAVAWIASFTLCTLADAMLGRWVLLPLFVAGFYGGTIIIAFVTYPMLPFWRTWLRRRGLIAWYLIEVGGLWGTTMVVLFWLSPWWLRWGWNGALTLHMVGGALFVGSVVAGTWAVAKLGSGDSRRPGPGPTRLPAPLRRTRPRGTLRCPIPSLLRARAPFRSKA